jgi:tetratricopeptide (TPR) repeat protein/predicted Ser/Thr protein kinase
VPELTSNDVLVGRLALSQGKITRPQLDQAIAAYRGGQAPSLAHAIVGARFVTTDDMRAIIETARAQEASGAGASTTGSMFGRPAPIPDPNGSVFGRPAPRADTSGSGFGRPAPPPGAASWSAQPAAPPLATMPSGDISGLQSVRQRGGAIALNAALPKTGTPAHDTLRSQYEDYVLGRLLVARRILSDPQLQDLTRRQKLELTANGYADPLPRVLMRAGLVSPALIDQLSNEVRRKVFACPRCGDCNFVEPGPEPQRLACRRCQGPVDIPSADGRMPPPPPGAFDPQAMTNAEGAGEVTRPMDVAPGAFGGAPSGFGAAPSAFGAPAPAFGGAPSGFGAPAPAFGGAPSGFGAPAAPTAPGVGSMAATAAGFGSTPGFGAGAGGAGGLPEGQPESVGEWVIEREIGRGGMGVIYLARHRTRGEKSALKLMLNAPQASEKKQKRFTREVDAARKLNHPNIVRLLDAGDHEGFPYFCMEFVDGKPLDKLLKDELDLELGMEVLEKLCRGVHYAHEQGIVHRDLKPANVLVDDNMNPKLTDFGLAKSEDHKSVLTKTGAVVGTPYYLSPEQARGNSKDVDRRADIYALGVIMYELITGRLPFVGQTTVELYNRILNDDPPPPTKVKPQLTKEIETVCLKALEKDPRERYQRAEDLGDDIKALLEARPIKARPRSLFKRLLRRLKKKGMGTILAVAVVTSLGLIGASAAYYVYRQRQDAQNNLALNERDKVVKQLEGAAAIVSQSIVDGEKALAVGREHDALEAAKQGVQAGEQMEAALTLPKLEANKTWAEKLRADRGLEARRTHASALVLRARVFVAADDPQAVEKAQKDLEEAAKLEQDSPEVVCAQAELSVLAQHVSEAIERLKAAADYVPARLLEAKIQRLIRDDPAEAMHSLNAAIELLKSDPKSAAPGSIREAWARSLARVLAEKALNTMAFEAEEPPTRALPFADDAVKLAPDLWETHAARARVLAALGRRYESHDELAKVGELGKDQLDALLDEGDVLLSLRRPEEAREVADKALAKSADSLDAMVLRARVHDALLEDKDARGDAEQAAAHAAGVKKFWVAGARARRLLARAVLMGGDAAEIKNKGVEHANAAREFDQEGLATKIVYARVNLSAPLGQAANPNLDTAEKYVRDHQKRWSTNPEAKRVLAMFAEVRNPGPQLAKAKDPAINKAMKSDPGSPWIHALMARADLAGRPPTDHEPTEEANKEASRALELERDTRRDEGYYFALGLRRALKGGSPEEAAAAFRRSIYIDPLHVQALVALGNVLTLTNASLGSRYFALSLGGGRKDELPANHLFAGGREGLALVMKRPRFGNEVDRNPMARADVYRQAIDELDRAAKLRGDETASMLGLRAYLEVYMLEAVSQFQKGIDYAARTNAIAAVFSRACALEPANEQLIEDRYGATNILAYSKQAPPEVSQLAGEAKREYDFVKNDLRSRTDEAQDSCREADRQQKQGSAAAAADAAKHATRKAPWLVDGWLALASGRAASGDTAGSLSALARGVCADKTLRSLGALATAIRELRAAKKTFSASEATDAAGRDDEAAPVSTETRTFVKIIEGAAQALLAGDPKSAGAREASEAARVLVTRRPEQLAYVFARGLAALGAGELEDATRELGFCALVGDDKGELWWVSALASARASDSYPANDWRRAAAADDALAALEQSVAGTPDVKKEATEDPELKAVAARLR